MYLGCIPEQILPEWIRLGILLIREESNIYCRCLTTIFLIMEQDSIFEIVPPAWTSNLVFTGTNPMGFYDYRPLMSDARRTPQRR